MREETPEEIKNQRDCLLKIEGQAQKREEESNRVIKLLVAAGLVSEEKVEQARELARSL